MLEHHIQRSIVYALAFSEGLRFSELKPTELENKAFDYHLKKVILSGLVRKRSDGKYELTSEGKRVGKGALKKQTRLIDRAYSILLLAIRRSEDGAWLLYRRQTHPLLGLTGFMQAQPSADTSAAEVARQSCLAKTGLDGTFTVHGHGYFTVMRGEELESFIHFTLLRCSDITGQLSPDNGSPEYYWDGEPDFSAPDMLPNMRTLHKMYEASAGAYVEKTFLL